MSFKKIIIIFFSLTLLVLLLGLIFKVAKEGALPENNTEQEGDGAALEVEEILEPEETLEVEEILEPEETFEIEDVLLEEVFIPTIPTSTPPTSATKKQMIVVEKED